MSTFFKTEVKKTGSGLFPNILSYPQGLPVSREDTQIIAGRKINGRTSKISVYANDGNRTVKYKGTDFGDNSAKKDTCKFAIGVRNKLKGSFRLIKSDHVFVMKPHVIRECNITRNSSLSYQERKQTLTDEFGSRKKKRALSAAQSNIIVAENIIGAKAVEAMLKEGSSEDKKSEVMEAAEYALLKSRKRGRAK